jgi:hypothetical protein
VSINRDHQHSLFGRSIDAPSRRPSAGYELRWPEMQLLAAATPRASKKRGLDEVGTSIGSSESRYGPRYPAGGRSISNARRSWSSPDRSTTFRPIPTHRGEKKIACAREGTRDHRINGSTTIACAGYEKRLPSAR